MLKISRVQRGVPNITNKTENLVGFVIALFNGAPGIPQRLPPPLERADARWLKSEEGCKVMLVISQRGPCNPISTKQVLESLLTIPGDVEAWALDYPRKRLHRCAEARLIREVPRDKKSRWFCGNPKLPELVSCCQATLEQIILKLGDEIAEREQKRDTLRRFLP